MKSPTAEEHLELELLSRFIDQMPQQLRRTAIKELFKMIGFPEARKLLLKIMASDLTTLERSRDWAQGLSRPEEMAAELRQLREKGGLEFDQFSAELEQVVNRSEHPGP
jgi:hypothetical protein